MDDFLIRSKGCVEHLERDAQDKCARTLLHQLTRSPTYYLKVQSMKYKMNLLISTLAFVLFTFSAYSYADAGYAIAAFRDGCLKSGQDNSEVYEIFNEYGFSMPTDDKLVFEWNGVGYAGFGAIAKEGSESEVYTGGCFVYLKGTPIIKVATTVNSLLKEKSKSIETRKIENDFYWIMPEVEGV